jgi:hypothetical protein
MAARDIAQQLACENWRARSASSTTSTLIALDVVELHVARTQCAAIAALADIQPADGSSRVDAVQEILRSIDISVIFTTAYPERLLTGKKPELSYLVAKTYRFDYPQAQCADQADTFHAPEVALNELRVVVTTSRSSHATRKLGSKV